jgi:hypothetical protein
MWLKYPKATSLNGLFLKIWIKALRSVCDIYVVIARSYFVILSNSIFVAFTIDFGIVLEILSNSFSVSNSKCPFVSYWYVNFAKSPKYL